jgi:hypothetical protein
MLYFITTKAHTFISAGFTEEIIATDITHHDVRGEAIGSYALERVLPTGQRRPRPLVFTQVKGFYAQEPDGRVYF